MGPHIYDGNGDLIWSGVDAFNGYDAFDFKVTNVGGKDVLTAIWPHGNGSVIINDNYELQKFVHTGVEKVTLNMHDFQIVDNGTRALYLKKDLKKTSTENSLAVDFDGHCNAEFTGFDEIDLASDKLLFRWSPEGRIGLDESTIRRPRRQCRKQKPWDWL